MRNLTQEINAQRRSSESTPNYMSTEREAHLPRDQLESSTNKMFDTINANFIRLVISNLKALPISSLLWKRQDVSVGEEDGYVTAGYGPRKGERRLLPLPTLLIHLITRPSGWLKAGCMATWHAVTPTPLSDEGFVLCYRTVNFWGNSEKPRRKKKKKNSRQPHLSQIAYNSVWHFEARPRPLWRPRWGWCNLWNSSALPALLPSHVQSRHLVTFTLIRCFKEWGLHRQRGLVCFQKNNTMADLSLQAQGFRK